MSALGRSQLGINTFIPVGYSMGGTVAQLVWKRHENRVRGLVLAATSGHFASSKRERRAFTLLTGISNASRFTPRQVRDFISDRLYVSRKTMTWEPWAAHQLSSHDWRHILEAGAALGRFDSRAWLGDIDVPTSVVVTTQDTVVPVERQQRLVESIPNVRAFHVEAGHNAVYAAADRYVPVLLEEAVAALAVRPDGTYVTPTNPARRGEVVIAAVTGLGQTTPPAVTSALR